MEYDCLDINAYALGRAINDDDEESATFYENLFWENSSDRYKLMKAIQYENSRNEETERYEENVEEDE